MPDYELQRTNLAAIGKSVWLGAVADSSARSARRLRISPAPPAGNVAPMTEAAAPARDQAGAPADSGIVSVETRSAKTLPGLAGVLLALVGLGMIAGGVPA